MICPVCGSRTLTEKTDRQTGETYWMCSSGHALSRKPNSHKPQWDDVNPDPSARLNPAKPTLDELDQWGVVSKR
jgi:hypothetical protein